MIAANSQNGRNFKAWRIYDGKKTVATVHHFASPEKQHEVAKKFAAVDDLLEACRKGQFLAESLYHLQGNEEAGKYAAFIKKAIDKATA